MDKPANRVEDIYAMADYIANFQGVNKDQIGLLVICGGGGYSIKAAQSDKRFRAVATVSMFNTGEVRHNGFMRTQVATIQERLRQASEARAKVAQGEAPTYLGDVANLTDEEVAKIPTDLYRQGFEYYLRTHAHPNSSFRYTADSMLDLMTFDATDQIELIDQPLLMIMGDKADSGYMTQEAYEKATGTKDKELFKIKGATHIETYWKPEYVTQITQKLTDFYNNKLK